MFSMSVSSTNISPMKLIGKAEIGDMIFDLCPAFSKHRIIIDERMSQQAGPAVLPWQMPCNSSSNEAKMYLNLLSLSVDSISYSEWIQHCLCNARFATDCSQCQCQHYMVDPIITLICVCQYCCHINYQLTRYVHCQSIV